MAEPRCPHDGGKCHHGCTDTCWRKAQGMSLTKPWDGFPVDSDAPVLRYVWGHATTDREELWQGWCASREEAIAAGRTEYEGEDFWICRGIKVDATRYVPDVDWILERMAESAYDDVGDLGDDFPDVDEDKKKALAALLADWASDIECRFWVSDPTTAEHIKPEGENHGQEEEDEAPLH